MAILFIDLIALGDDDPEVRDLASDWLDAGHYVIYVVDANAPPGRWRSLIGSHPRALGVPAAGPRYLALVLEYALEEIRTADRRGGGDGLCRRFRATGGRECAVATVPGRLPPAAAAALGLRVLIKSPPAQARMP